VAPTSPERVTLVAALGRDRGRAVWTALGGAAVFAASGRAAVRGVGPAERRWFEVLNGLPARPYPVVWPVMQVGSLGGVLATSAATALVGRPQLAGRLLVCGSATWLGAKAVKPFIRRGRPGTALDVSRLLGRPQRGLGYPSGHAAVAATLAVVASPHLPRVARPLAWAAAATAGCARVYVGAHLPLDVAGGAALGCAVGATAHLVTA